MLCDILQEVDDGQMLGADAFALAALDAVAGLAPVVGDDGVFTHGAEAGAALFAVLHIEDLRDRNSHGTSFGTVMAGRTLNRRRMSHDPLCLLNNLLFFFI